MIRVLLAEDQAMVRGALAALLSLQPDIDIVADVGSGDEVLAATRRHRPDIVLLDIEMPGIDGLQAARQLRDAELPAKVVILTTFGRPGYLHTALSAGAAAFLLKDAPAAHLAVAIRRVAAGETVIDPTLAVTSLTTGTSPLTVRETEVLAAARGHDKVTQLARQLHLSPGTVRNHLSASIQKLGARTRAEAVDIAERQGWL